MGFLIPSVPAIVPELVDIDVLIRQERDRLWELEEAGTPEGPGYLNHLLREKARGITQEIVNL